MEYLKIPEFPRLRGEKAIKALYNFIDELEEQRGKELTKKQTAALIKLARGLISSIEAETRPDTSGKDIKETLFVPFTHSPLLFSTRATSNGTLYLGELFTTTSR